METIIGQAELAEELEGGRHLCVGRVAVVCGIVPGPVERSGTKDVEPVPAEAMPVADSQAQMVFHPPAEDHLVLVIVAIGQRVLGVRSFELDMRDIAKYRACAQGCICISHSKLL